MGGACGASKVVGFKEGDGDKSQMFENNYPDPETLQDMWINTILTKYMSPDTLIVHKHELISQYYVLRCLCSIVFCNYKCIYLFKQN
jgi:hypothetical protein